MLFKGESISIDLQYLAWFHMTLVAHGCPILINCADGEDAARHTEYIITPDETINKRYGNTTVKN